RLPLVPSPSGRRLGGGGATRRLPTRALLLGGHRPRFRTGGGAHPWQFRKAAVAAFILIEMKTAARCYCGGLSLAALGRLAGGVGGDSPTASARRSQRARPTADGRGAANHGTRPVAPPHPALSRRERGQEKLHPRPHPS